VISRDLLVPLAASLGLVAIVVSAVPLLRDRDQVPVRDRRPVLLGALQGLRLHPHVISAHPCSGSLQHLLGLLRGRHGQDELGPHSFYVALLVETGLVGASVFAVYLWYLFHRLNALRRIGRHLGALGDPAAARVRPLAWGMIAALAGTLVANAFYLTMTFYYFYVFGMLILAAPIVFGRRLPAPAAAERTQPARAKLSPAVG
jgi:hypothetical protein